MAADEIEQDINRLLTSLENSNVVERKRSLEKMLVLLNNMENISSQSCPNKDEINGNDAFMSLWDEKISRSVYRCLDDPGERCRETAAEIVLKVINVTMDVKNIHLSYLFPVLRHRLANRSGERSLEPSEEVRLCFLAIMIGILRKELLVNSDESKLFPYIDDVFAVLKTTLTDSFGDVKSLSCEGVEKAADVFKQDFHLMGNTLITPLIQCLSHQQKKVRISAVHAIGVVILSTTSSDFNQVAPHLAQRLFDHVPQVRLQVSITVGKLLLEWKYAAANCVYLLPLLLTSLEDEVKENREETLQVWKKVGKQWIENEVQYDSRMKDRIDFSVEPLIGCPNDFVRHDLGCRQYITRVVSKLIPALKNDIKDWLVETRIKASSLTYIIICHMEETAAITQHAEKLLNLMQEGVTDTEIKVVRNMCRVANIYGHFIPPKTWCPLIIERIMSQPNTYDLMILANILHGTNPNSFIECAGDIASALQDDSVCLVIDDEYLEELLECLNALLSKSGARVGDIQSHLFKACISIIALTHKEELKMEGRKFLDELVITLNTTKIELFKKELHGQLEMMSNECSKWGSSSRRVEVFSTLLQESGSAVGYYPDLVTDIFVTVLSPSSESDKASSAMAEPELQLKLFIVLSRQLYNYQQTLNSNNRFESYVLKVVTDVIMPALTWRSGRKASAIRTAATSSLWSIFESRCIPPQCLMEANNSVYAKLLSTINGLLDDDAEKTRFISCQIYERIFYQFGVLILPQVLAKILPVVTKRLDDTSKEVRLACLRALKASSFCLMSNEKPTVDPETVDNLYSTILIHMDDNDEGIRNTALEALTVLGKVYPHRLLDLTGQSELKNKHKKECIDLVHCLKSLNFEQ